MPSTHKNPPAPFDSQQPFGQLEGLHVAIGVSHAWSLGSHCAKPSEVQFAQETPPVPHWVICVPLWQLPLPSQHPLGQLAALQVVLIVTQVWLCGAHVLFAAQLEHASPFVPHAAVDVPAWQLPLLSQQPVGHVDGPHEVASDVIMVMPLSSGLP